MTSGTGMAGWDRTMVPGFNRRARARVEGSIQPYSARSASAASSRPVTRMAAFSRTSGATREAVCCAPDQQHAQGPAALRDVDEHVLQRAGALARRVLVQLVQHDDRQRQALTGLLLLMEGLVQERAHHEALRLIVQRLDGHHGDGGARAIDAVRLAGAHEMSEPRGRGDQPPHEGRHGPRLHAGRPGRVRLAAVFGIEVVAHRLGQRGEIRDDGLARRRVHQLAPLVRHRTGIAQHDGAGLPGHVRGEPLELGLDALADERELVLRVVRVRETELQEVLVDELARGPGEDLDAFLAPAGVGQEHVAGAPARRRPEPDARERRGRHAQRLPARARVVVEQAVRRVEPEQVLALHVEDQHAQVGGALTDQRRVLARREHAQEEQRERRLRGHAADAADGHVPALAPVEEVEVHVHGDAVAPQADGQRAAHLVHVERLRALLAGGALHDLAGVGGDPHLGVDARDRHARRAHLRGRHDPELRHAVRVGLERGALVHGLGLGHDAVRADLAGLRHLRAHQDQVVQLQVVVVVQHHAERAGGGVLGAEHAPDAVLAILAHDASVMTAPRSAR